MQKAKWLSDEALQIAEKKREAKGKGGKERYTHLNAEFQRIARRDKKDFLSDQFKETEENNRMKRLESSSRNLDTKGIFHAKMDTKKDKNGGPNRSRRVGKNTQKNYTKKDFHDRHNHDGVITHLEPDILECEIKWALGNITTNKASGGDGILVELFQILKMIL